MMNNVKSHSQQSEEQTRIREREVRRILECRMRGLNKVRVQWECERESQIETKECKGEWMRVRKRQERAKKWERELNRDKRVQWDCVRELSRDTRESGTHSRAACAWPVPCPPGPPGCPVGPRALPPAMAAGMPPGFWTICKIKPIFAILCQ